MVGGPPPAVKACKGDDRIQRELLVPPQGQKLIDVVLLGRTDAQEGDAQLHGLAIGGAGGKPPGQGPRPSGSQRLRPYETLEQRIHVVHHGVLADERVEVLHGRGVRPG